MPQVYPGLARSAEKKRTCLREAFVEAIAASLALTKGDPSPQLVDHTRFLGSSSTGRTVLERRTGSVGVKSSESTDQNAGILTRGVRPLSSAVLGIPSAVVRLVSLHGLSWAENEKKEETANR